MLFKQLCGLALSSLLTLPTGGGIFNPVEEWASLSGGEVSQVNVYLNNNSQYMLYESTQYNGSDKYIDYTSALDVGVHIGYANGNQQYYGYITTSISNNNVNGGWKVLDDGIGNIGSTFYLWGVNNFEIEFYTHGTKLPSSGVWEYPAPTVTVTGGSLFSTQPTGLQLAQIINAIAQENNQLTQIYNNGTDSNLKLDDVISQLESTLSFLNSMNLNIDELDNNTQASLLSIYNNISSFASQNHVDLSSINNTLIRFKNYQIPLFSYEAYYALITSKASIIENSSLSFRNLGYYPFLHLDANQSVIDKFSFFGTSGETNIFVYYHEVNNDSYLNAFTLYDRSGNAVSKTSSVKLSNGFKYFTWNKSNWVNFVSDRSIDFVPVYIGSVSNIPEDIASLIGFNKNSSLTGEMDSVDQSLNAASDLESQYFNSVDSQFNNSLDNVTPSSDLISNSNFLNSANWVKIQFDRLTNQNAFGSLLGFSLLLGLALAIIGRVL